MDELRIMSSEANSLEGIKEKYKKAIIDNYEARLLECKNKRISNIDDINQERRIFDSIQYKNAFDDSLGSNDRWGIVSRKNFFGLRADFLPENGKGLRKDNRLYLRLISGRFQMQKFPGVTSKKFFPRAINISDINTRNEEEKFSELEEFYNMNNREVFEKYGVYANLRSDNGSQTNLLANCVILDSLLEERYSEIEDIFCFSPYGYVTTITLSDGTEIIANSADSKDAHLPKGITIKKDGKKANVNFDTKSKERKTDFLTDIDDLEVENVVYTGDAELIEQLQQAMQTQFESQRKSKKVDNKNYYEEYSEIASKLLDKAGVGSYDEYYELDEFTISLLSDGSTVCIKSNELDTAFVIDGEKCVFSDLEGDVVVEYYSDGLHTLSSIDECLDKIEQKEPQKIETVQKVREFAKKLDELSLDKSNKVDNDLLIRKVIDGGVKDSDVINFQEKLIRTANNTKEGPDLDENGSNGSGGMQL